MISLIIPALNEEKTLEAAIRSAGPEDVEIIVSDGGSSDGTIAIAEKLAHKVVISPRGRGLQLNAGAANSKGDILVFLHADTVLPDNWKGEVYRVLSDRTIRCGAFRFTLPEENLLARCMSFVVNLRSRWMKMPYGDQGIFMRREVFDSIGGFRDIPIMEDVDLVRRLGREGKVAIAALPVVTSSRRWHNLGWIKTCLINQILLSMFFLGVAPEKLARLYKTFR